MVRQLGADVAPPPRTPLPLPVRGGSCWDGGSGGKSDYSLGDAGAMWDMVGLRSRMCSVRTVRSSRQPASCLTILPPGTERSVVSLTPRGAAFGERSIRRELDLNGRRQAVVAIGLPPFGDRTEGLPAPAATRVRVLSGGPILTIDRTIFEMWLGQPLNPRRTSARTL